MNIEQIVEIVRMNQWMNIAMYGIIMLTIAFSTMWILREIWSLRSFDSLWLSIVISKNNDKMTVYLDGVKNV